MPADENEELKPEVEVYETSSDLEVININVTPKLGRTWTVRNNTSSMDAAVNEKISKIIYKSDDLWNCFVCGRTTKKSSDIRRHAELHIEGLAFNCPLCDQTFQSRTKLKHHKLNLCKMSTSGNN